MKLKAVRHGVLSFQTGPNMFEGEDLGNEGGHPDLGGGGGSLEHQLQHEQLKMEHMAQLHKLNELCWDTCIGVPSSSLSSRDSTCLTNCVNRFVDTTLFITNRFSNIAQKMNKN